MKTFGLPTTLAACVARAVAFTALWGIAFSSLATAAETSAGGKSPQPEVSLSLRGTWDGQVEVGESLRVAVRVDVPGEGAGKIVLAPSKGSWIEATAVEILSASGSSVVATAKPALAGAATETSVVVDAEQAAHGLWWFAGESTAPLAPGEYLVRAKLAIRDGAGWKGESVSEPMAFSVVAASNDPQRATSRILARAHAAFLQDAPAQAAAMLDEVLARDPDNIPVLEMRAAICLSGGNPAGAYVCVNRARSLSVRLGGHPSAQLHEFAARIEGAMGKRSSTPPPAPEAWAFPPRIVFSPIRPETPQTAAPRADSASPIAANEPKAAITPPPVSSQASGVPPVAKPSATPAPAAGDVSPVVIAKTPGPGVVVPSAELSEPKIIADLYGRWASGATAGSQYGRAQYSAAQATGAPNVSVAGNSAQAWCPAERDKGMDWLDVTFAEPVEAVELRVRQNDASGAIVKVEAFESDGKAHVWWEGVDPHKPASVREIVWFAVRVPKTDYAVARVKLTLNLASGPGYKQIDAVQLVAAE